MRTASVLWTYVQLMSWKDRVLALALAVVVVAFLVFSALWGANIGAHVGAKGWACGQTLKGAPYCVRDPEAPTENGSKAP